MTNLLVEAFAAALVLLPTFLVLHKIRFHSIRTSFHYVFFAFYLAAVYNIVGLPTVQFMVFDVNLNLIPLVGMAEDLSGTVLNVLLFVPLGFFLPLMWRKYRRMKTTLLFGMGMTAAIELLQLLAYRATDINDIITNFAGTVIGYMLFRLVMHILSQNILGDRNAKDLTIIFLSVAGTMFFIQPLIASGIYKIT